jgi:uncharacterized protein (TIGR02001 family)
MKLKFFFLLSFFFPSSLLAGHFVSEASVVSDYIYRGLTKTDHAPSFRGSLHYDFNFGLNLGASLANIGANESRGMEDRSDLSYTHFFNEIFGVNGAVKFYYNPFASSANTVDYEFGVFITKMLHLSVFYSPKHFGKGTNATYYLAEGWFEALPSEHIFVNLSSGYNRFGNEAYAGNKNYTDYKIAVHKRHENHDIGLFLVGTNRRVYDGLLVNEAARDYGFGASYQLKLN